VELGDWHSVIHSAGVSETVVIFTTEEIVGDYELPDGWHCIGPLMEPAPPTAPPGERPLVYVCFGTSFNARAELFRAVVEGLADEPVEVLVSTGDGRVLPEDLEPLPANVAVRDFVPAREILARAAVHITHGGCNSTHECLLAGVPMVLLPQALDQYPLAGRIEELGAGRHVAEDPAEIRAAVRWILEDDSPRARARELAQHLAQYDGESRVAAVVERALADSTAISA
jgi:demethyllactenocin mycarosyltransferase